MEQYGKLITSGRYMQKTHSSDVQEDSPLFAVSDDPKVTLGLV